MSNERYAAFHTIVASGFMSSVATDSAGVLATFNAAKAHLFPRTQRSTKHLRSFVLIGITVVVVFNANIAAWGVISASSPAVSAVEFFDLVMAGQGTSAVLQLADMAQSVGGWFPAPGDRLVFDDTLACNVRGAVLIADRPPFECVDARLARFTSGCTDDFVTRQNQIRLGRAAFVVTHADGISTPRLSVDDALSALIEEVGHSWQEYQFETAGLGGERTRVTTYENWLYWAHGWEYQVKRYILSLDGTLLQLSSEERAAFIEAMCQSDGYANPIGHHVPAYGAPTGWPNPDGWPTIDPVPGDHAAFCTQSRPI